MNLFLIVYERDNSCDWFFEISKDNLANNNKEVKHLIASHYEIDVDMFDEYISDYWVNKIDKVESYKVKLVKE